MCGIFYYKNKKTNKENQTLINTFEKLIEE